MIPVPSTFVLLPRHRMMEASDRKNAVKLLGFPAANWAGRILPTCFGSEGFKFLKLMTAGKALIFVIGHG